MKSKKILENTLWAILTIVFASLTLLYPIVRSEQNKNDFYISSKKFEYSSELKNRDVNESILRAKKALHKAIYYVGDAFKPVRFNDAWISSSPNLLEYIQNKKTPYTNTSHEFLVQSLGILYDLIIAHQHTKDNKFLLKGYKIIDNWYAMNDRFNPFQSMLVWNDHAVSERIISILLFNDYAIQFIDPDGKTKDVINKVTKDSVIYLANAYNYKFKHNHGIYEDFALLVSASYLTNKEQRQHYFKIAMDRFKQQVMETFDKQGIHLENSPKYHLIITDLLNDFVRYAKKLNLHFDDIVLDRIKLANRNKYFFVLNNGNVPPVGDSMYRPYSSFEKLKDEVLISQDAGYTIFKNKNFYLLIRTQSVNDVHRHKDQLSFIYEYKKDLIVSEPGFLYYSSSKENIFVRSRKAHNVVYSKEQKEINYYFNKFLNNKHFFYCQLESADKTISRIFLLDKESKELVMQDVINDHQNEKNFEILNLSSDVVKVKQTKNFKEIVMDNDHKYYIRSFQNKNDIDSNVLYGSTKPFFGGWRAIPYKNLVPSFTLLTPLNKKKNIKYTTAISLNPTKTYSDINKTITMLSNKAKVNISKSLVKINKSFYFIKKIEKKIKKKIHPSYYRRILLVKKESIIIIISLLISFLFRKRLYSRILVMFYISISFFNILVFFIT